MDFLEEKNIKIISLTSASIWQQRGVRIFEVLESDGEGAIPDLAKLIEDDQSGFCWRRRFSVPSAWDAFPALMVGLTGTGARKSATSPRGKCFGNRVEKSARASLWKTCRMIRCWRCCETRNQGFGGRSAFAGIGIAAEMGNISPAIAVPALAGLLAGSSSDECEEVLWALASVWPRRGLRCARAFAPVAGSGSTRPHRRCGSPQANRTACLGKGGNRMRISFLLLATVLAMPLACAAADVLECSEGGIIRGLKAEKRIALVFTAHTFAEGGDKILDELAKHHAKGSFFVTGEFLDNTNFQPLARRIVKEGHYLGPHSDKHLLYCPWDGPKKTLVTREEFETDLNRNLDKITRLGVRRSEIKYWLPAYEWYNRDIVDWSRAMGLTLVNYTPGTRSNADYLEDNVKNFYFLACHSGEHRKKGAERPAWAEWLSVADTSRCWAKPCGQVKRPLR